MRPPGARTSAEWQEFAERQLGAWWRQWEAPLRRYDDLAQTVAAGDNFAWFAQQMGLGRKRLLADALVQERYGTEGRVLVLCPPTVRLSWRQSLLDAGFAAERVDTLSAWQLGSPKSRARSPYYIAAKLYSADAIIIEPPVRPQTKLFGALANHVREVGSRSQIVTTTTLVWSAQLSPPRYADSCLKLLGLLDAPEDIKVCWADDCWKATA